MSPGVPVHELRLAAQGLAGPPAADALAPVARLLAVQAQDLRGARLAVRARSAGVTAADVDAALAAGDAVVTWLNRGTLHLVCREDLPWLHALTTPPLMTATMRRLAQEGVDPAAADRGVAVVDRALADEGPLDRDRLRERLDRAGVPTAGQALAHVLGLAGLRGVALRGPAVPGGQAFVRWADWLGTPAPVDRASARAELARRYLRGHGPASDRDLARWAGLPLRDARAGLAAVAGELIHREDGLVDLARRAEPAGLPPPRLLGPFEPLLLGWGSRADVVGPHAGLVTMNGVFRPFAMVRGRAVGTWGVPGGRVALDLWEDVAGRTARALARDARAVEAFLATGAPGPGVRPDA